MPQLRNNPRLLHIYLDALFLRDPHLSFEFHDLQVELYAAYAPAKLIDFLKASNYYSLEKVTLYGSPSRRQLIQLGYTALRSLTLTQLLLYSRHIALVSNGISSRKWCFCWVVWATIRRR